MAGIEERIEIWRSLDSSEKQVIALEYCSRNIVYWVNTFVTTYDPRVKPAIIPFNLFPKQEEYLLWRQEVRSRQDNGLIEKSRDMGVTWLNVCSQVHSWLFEPGYKGAFGSRKEMLVDRPGDMDSIFEKIRFLLRSLPKWMLPKGFNWRKHSSYMKLINPENGAVITGEAGDNIGRGGRNTVYDWDETAFTERPLMVEAALSNNTNTIFYTSSPNGMNFFYKKRMSLSAECIFTMFWKDDPRKDDAWYNKMCAKFDEVIVASEVDLDYAASIEGIFIPAKWVQAAIALEIPVRGRPNAGLDVATSGKNKNVFTYRPGLNTVQVIESWEGLNTTQTAYKASELMRSLKCPHIAYDNDGVGAGVSGTYGTMSDIFFNYTPVHGAGKPSEKEWVGENRTSEEKFANKRAELWGLLRDRFRKTYNYVNNIAIYPLDELISIPNHPTLIAQISSPLGKTTHTGKILIESKQDMIKRGVASPDFADSLAYSEEEGEILNYLLFA